jgi:hypothetical protein
MNPTIANQLVQERINGLISETARRRSHHPVPRRRRIRFKPLRWTNPELWRHSGRSRRAL